MIEGTKKPILLLLGLLFFSGTAAAQPTVLLSTFGSYELESKTTGWGLEGSLSWRRINPAGGFSSLEAFFGGLLNPQSGVFDREQILLRSLLPLNDGRLDSAVAFSTSALGWNEEIRYFEPSWRIDYDFPSEPKKPYWRIGYQGYVRIQPDEEDVFQEELSIALGFRPSIRFGMDSRLGAAWEYRYELFPVDASGTPEDQRRSDLLIDLEITLDGLFGYFWDWEWESRAVWRQSNGTYFNSPLFIADSESYLGLEETATVSWSPHQRIDLGGSLFAKGYRYLHRQALTVAETLSGQPLALFSYGGDLHLDWHLGGGVFAAAAVEAGQTLANESTFAGWSLTMRAAIELSF